MAHPRPTKLRIHRRQSGFTQEEVAFLLGMRVHSLVSRHEGLKREPDLRIAFAYQLVFSSSAHDLFPSVFTDVCNVLAQRARELAERLEPARSGCRSGRKLEMLRSLAECKCEPPSIALNSILAVVPVSRGFGFVVLDSAQRAIDWGVKDVRHNTHAGSVLKAREIMDAHRPEILALEDWNDNYARRSGPTKAVLRSLGRIASSRSIGVELFTRLQVRSTLANFNATTNHDIAIAVAELVPDLRPLLPRPRKPWQSEQYVMAIFRAGALAISCFAGRERTDA